MPSSVELLSESSAGTGDGVLGDTVELTIGLRFSSCPFDLWRNSLLSFFFAATLDLPLRDCFVVGFFL